MITYEGITYQLKFLEKMAEKISFLQIFLSNLQEKSYVIWEFLVVIMWYTLPYNKFLYDKFINFYKNNHL